MKYSILCLDGSTGEEENYQETIVTLEHVTQETAIDIAESLLLKKTENKSVSGENLIIYETRLHDEESNVNDMHVIADHIWVQSINFDQISREHVQIVKYGVERWYADTSSNPIVLEMPTGEKMQIAEIYDHHGYLTVVSFLLGAKLNKKSKENNTYRRVSNYSYSSRHTRDFLSKLFSKVC